MAEFSVSLWLVLRLLHWECIVSAVTGSWAALFAKGKAGYVQSLLGSFRFRSWIGNVQWLLRKVQCLFTYAPSAAEGFAPSWSVALCLGWCVAGYAPRDFTPVHLFTGYACRTRVRVGWGLKWAHCFAGRVYLIVCCILQGVSLTAWSIKHNCRSGKGKNILENEEKML